MQKGSGRCCSNCALVLGLGRLGPVAVFKIVDMNHESFKIRDYYNFKLLIVNPEVWAIRLVVVRGLGHSQP